MVSPEVLIASIKSQTVSAQKRCRVAQGRIKYMMLIAIFQTKTTSYFIYEIFDFICNIPNIVGVIVLINHSRYLTFLS